MPKRQSGNKKNKQSNFAKLSIFQPNKYRFKKSCPLSSKLKDSAAAKAVYSPRECPAKKEALFRLISNSFLIS